MQNTEINGASIQGDLDREVKSLFENFRVNEDDRHVYVVGNNLDFDIVAQRAIDLLGSKLAGAASFSSVPVFNPFSSEEMLFVLPREFLGRSNSVETVDLLFCQGFIASDREVRAMISRVLAVLEVRNIVVAAPSINSAAKEQLENYFFDDSNQPVRIVSNRIPNLSSTEAWKAQVVYYRDLLADRGTNLYELPAFMRQSIRGKLKHVPQVVDTSPKL